MTILNLLEHDYGVRPRSLTPLLARPDKQVYRLDHAGLLPWVVRVYAGSERADEIASDAAVLDFLEQRGYPAERLIRASDGSPVVVDDNLTVLVTTCVEGEAVDFAPTSLYALAECVGRLHALQLPRAPGQPEIRPAGMLPIRELAYARGRLADVANRVPAYRRDRYDKMLAAIDALDLGPDLPIVLIHNDCHPSNARKRADGSVVLIDWEGAGLGPTVIDLGFLLVSAEIEAFRPNRLKPDPARVNAIVDGYGQHRRPSSRELDLLPDAIRFRSLVAGAGEIADAIEKNRPLEENPWWLARLQATEDLAERARARFERLR